MSIPVGTASPSQTINRVTLHQNVPNPFNPATTISFSLPKDGLAEISIYDAAGRRVRSLASREFESGIHELRWNGKDDAGRAVASGVYHYRLRTEKGTDSRPMTLVR